MHASRRGTLCGMDAAEELTWTYLQRVLRRDACKRPQQTEAFLRKPADFVCEVGLCAAPHPVSGHAASTSM
ncbi:hypothetical protein E1J25_13260 [Xanthomonas hortorum pv. taraxaci]|nr:hypothetical protein [Xanthomonas hortorum pv. taraxaci]